MIDTGAEIPCIDLDTVKSLGDVITKTKIRAMDAGD